MINIHSKKECAPNHENRKHNEELGLKIRFYFMSLILLFILILILTIDIPICLQKDAYFVGIKVLIKRNILPIISTIFIIWGIFCCFKTEHDWNGVENPPYEIINVRNENYEYLTFLTTYIIPLICMDLKNVRYIIVLGFLLFLIGFIFIKVDLYYGNPALAILGYRLYKVDIKGSTSLQGIILISKDKLQNNDNIKWIKVGEHVWIARK